MLQEVSTKEYLEMWLCITACRCTLKLQRLCCVENIGILLNYRLCLKFSKFVDRFRYIFDAFRKWSRNYLCIDVGCRISGTLRSLVQTIYRALLSLSYDFLHVRINLSPRSWHLFSFLLRIARYKSLFYFKNVIEDHCDLITLSESLFRLGSQIDTAHHDVSDVVLKKWLTRVEEVKESLWKYKCTDW